MSLETLIQQRIASRLHQRDVTAFMAADLPAATADAVSRRLGWVDAPSTMAARLPEIAAFVAGTQQLRATDVYVLGMGGSSLCADVMRDAQPRARQAVRLHVVDTTDERTLRRLTDALVPERALFLVASKSGSTVEVIALERHFWAVMQRALGDRAGGHFAAITDPDTALVSLATARAYRHTFLNPADIGGRYSALSLFGLVPAALVGVDVEHVLASARAMAARCSSDNADNPGLSLGAFMSTHAASGRDKLTFILPPALASFGGWLEQLIAESTGKHGRGVLPVIGEPRGRFADYGPDRLFVVIGTPEAPFDQTTVRRLEQGQHPVLTMTMAMGDLGGEFYRWEFATAVAAAAFGVNPFDEPNVRETKVRTQALLDGRRVNGDFRVEPEFERHEGYLKRSVRHERTEVSPPRGRYLAILDFLPDEPWRQEKIDRLRTALRRRSGVAVTCGTGPRYLHSTGQYHKGGPDTGTFVVLTADDTVATPVPQTDYTFSMLKRAQALGDFDALAAAGRDVVHIHLEDRNTDITPEVEQLLVAMRPPARERRRSR